ncbi:uncharacterized protein LOC121538065 isoform X3 [Coregonus clupeaformis]|uniref:uncharacterized protein LOC121538065 isoform X3 n=1 Tax=Coregonus clupeaformis TaxID=59861 RepID=UPI001BE0F4DB|nr:uncharacterized protein LOC121538065 isoform X3 [Coregonus clupeaformis]
MLPLQGMAGEMEHSGKNNDLREEDMPAQGGVENQINEQHLRCIESMFREADTDGGGGLDMDQFRDVDIIFMKVDTNCDGSVDWVREENKTMNGSAVLSSVDQLLCAHCEVIVRLQFYPFQPQAGKKKTDSGEHGRNSGGSKGRAHNGRYLSISRNGVLNYWNERFSLLCTVNISQMQHTVGQPVRVTDMVCLSNINLLSISSTGRDVGVSVGISVQIRICMKAY